MTHARTLAHFLPKSTSDYSADALDDALMTSRTIPLIAILVGTSIGSASAGEWANLRGRIVYDGTPPVPKKIVVNKDEEVCGKYALDERLLVDPTNHGVRNVIVTLQLGRGESTDVHESYQATAESDALLDNVHCRFEPHVMLLRTTQKLVIRNSDPKGDSVKIDAIKNMPINVTLPAGQSHEQRFPKVESMPVHVGCSIHSWESGWLVVKDHPYMAVTDKDGNFEIKNVPAGKRTFTFWQEEAGYLREVVVGGKPQTWQRGIAEFDLEVGANDLGEIIVQPSLFRR